MSIIISAARLHEKLQTEQIIPIDVRIKEETYGTGKEAYKHDHLPNAIYMDFKKELSGAESFFPEVAAIKDTLETHGIDRQTKIVFYDEGNHRAASKGYVLLSYLGHEEVYILDGGVRAWHEAGYEWTNEIVTRPTTIYEVNLQENMLAQMNEVKESLARKDSVHVDSRMKKKFTGEIDSGYGKSGHIPGAQNFPAKDVFDTAGNWKSKESLQAHFAPIRHKKEQIVSCGLGNSACMNLVALREAGFENVKLFSGGFSEWVQDDENEVATEKQ